MTEEWRPVVGYAGLYEVSSLGRVRSLDRLVQRTRGGDYMQRGRIRRPATGKDNPYPSLSLSRDGKNVTHYVHTLVLEAFVGPCPVGMEACHGDGNHTNNVPENLRWDTRQNNAHDKNAHGTSPQGERHGHAKLTDDLVRALRVRRAVGASFTDLSIEFGISRMTAHRAVTRKSWSHIA